MIMKFRNIKFRKNWGETRPGTKAFKPKNQYSRRAKHQGRRDWNASVGGDCY